MRALLWCNGKISNPEIVDHLSQGVTLFGVDGGADKAAKLGFNVEQVIGDLDSVNRTNWENTTILSDESSSDLVKALHYVSNRGYKEVDVVGIEGGCPDHILGIWAALCDAPPNLNIRLHHELGKTVRYHPNSGKMRLSMPIDTEFSVFALENCDNVEVTGAKWEINSEPMKFSTRGLHNIAKQENIFLTSDGIMAIIIHNH